MDQKLSRFLFVGAVVFAVVFAGRLSGKEMRENASARVFQDLLREEAPLLSGEIPSSRNETVSEEASPLFPISFLKVGNAPLPEIASRAFLIGDAVSGEIYVARGLEKRWPTASLTKLMTAVVASRHFSADELIAYGENGTLGIDAGGALPAGSYAASDLLSALLVGSDNGAGEAFAHAYGRDAFIRAMNETAVSWGLSETHFADPTGLSVSNQSTAHDLFSLFRRAFEDHRALFDLTRAPTASVTEAVSLAKQEIKNTSRFAGRADFLGGKTGYTDEANGNLISIFSREGRPILTIVLGTPDRFEDTERLFLWFQNNYRRSHTQE